VSLKQKHRLVVEVESLASSGKNYDVSMRMGRRRFRKKIKKVDELSTKIRVIYT